MHNLQSLRIKNLLGVSGPEPEVSGAFEATSGLKKLSLTGYLGPAHKWLRLPWSQLTRYEGSWELSPDQHLQVLSLATNLVECRFSINDERSSIPPSTLVVLEHLQTLELQVTSNTNVLEHLSLPALKSLLIHKPLWAKPKAGFLHPLSGFLSHSSRNLEKMKLVAEPLLDVDLIASLHETSALTELEIITMDLNFMSNSLLHDLTSDSFAIAPKLRKLGVDCRRKNFDDQSLVKMLQSRWTATENCAQLEAFLLRGVPLEHETIGALNKLRLDGMSVGYSMEKGLRSLYL
ncbi:hypothetical protein BD779DRAFT_477296 [Infundibulicybe gibba]|nr:hypothetical protein BD779DRAFT_477296 [Infundibulicybe gibba]